MKMKNSARLALIAVAAFGLIGAGCARKKVAAATPAVPQSAVSAPRQAPVPAPLRSDSVPARTAVGAPASGSPTTAEKARIDQLLARIEDAYFDYNQQTLRPDAIKALRSDSTELRDIISQYPGFKLTIEGHCDERGSEAYNLALGDARAKAAKDYLVGVGISDSQLAVISYGKDKPACEDHDEACWARNRRVHIAATK